MFWGYRLDFLKNLLLFDFNNFYNPRVGIDIILVSVLFYLGYIAIKNTRAIQFILVIGGILLLGSIASYFELELLDWLISSIRPAVVFLAIVLLQPELRRAFTELGKSPLVKFFNIKPNYELDEMIAAIQDLAEAKTGSIIVITRNISLRQYVDQAVILDANITSGLLKTIFIKNSPLHDGAVIIEQNRVASASTYLPMSDQLGTSTMGARHRSALGITEDTDAISLVTSEETGEISVCHEGKMIHPVKSFELKVLLTDLMDGKSSDESGTARKRSKQ